MAQVQVAQPISSAYPAAGQSYAQHFNARGELIPYAIVPRSEGIALVANTNGPGPGKTAPVPIDVDLDDDDLALESLELAYPDDEPMTAVPPPPPQPALACPTAMPPSAPAPEPRPATTASPSTPSVLPTPPPSQSPEETTRKRVMVPLPQRGIYFRPVPALNGNSHATAPERTSSGSLVAVNGTGPNASPVLIDATAPLVQALMAANGYATAAIPLAKGGMPRLPRRPHKVSAYIDSPARAGTGMPMPRPAVAPGISLPKLPPSAAHNPLLHAPPAHPAAAVAKLLCATPGCTGIAPVAGRRCLTCVRGSWQGLQEGNRRRQEEQEAEKSKASESAKVDVKVRKEGSKKRVRIMLPSSVDGEGEGEIIVLDKKGKRRADGEIVMLDKGKGKAVDEDADADADGESARSGWDSDLSDLTDSASETEVQEVRSPIRTPFKIRIPARTPKSTPEKASSPASAATPSSELLPKPAPSTPTTTTPAGPSTGTALPTPPAEPQQRLCTIARCRAPLPPLTEYRWKCCSPCRKQYREYQRERLGRLAGKLTNPGTPTASPKSDSAPLTPAPRLDPKEQADALRAQLAQKQWQREENRRALEAVTVPKAQTPTKPRPEGAEPGAWQLAGTAQLNQSEQCVTGARVCAGRGCVHILPSVEEWKWGWCGVCRVRERRIEERRFAKEGATPPEPEEPLVEYPVTPVQRPQRCMYADCGTLMAEDSEVAVAECDQCLRRKKVRRGGPGRPPGSKNRPKEPKPLMSKDPQQVASSEKLPEVPKKRKRVSPYPAYQTHGSLLRDFGARFHGFIEAQSYYSLMRGAQPPPQAMFDFSGEYSCISPDLDVVSRRATVEARAYCVKDDVARAGGLEFSPTSWVSILGAPPGVITRFACVHLVEVYQPPREPGQQPTSQTKSMQGELEVAVLPDNSHQYFSGEKTIVRFRLVG